MKQLQGTVVSTKMDKTIVVSVRNVFVHPVYEKRFVRNKKYIVHDEQSQASLGDEVIIQESRPLSKRKRWTLVKIITR